MFYLILLLLITPLFASKQVDQLNETNAFILANHNKMPAQEIQKKVLDSLDILNLKGKKDVKKYYQGEDRVTAFTTAINAALLYGNTSDEYSKLYQTRMVRDFERSFMRYFDTGLSEKIWEHLVAVHITMLGAIYHKQQNSVNLSPAIDKIYNDLNVLRLGRDPKFTNVLKKLSKDQIKKFLEKDGAFLKAYNKAKGLSTLKWTPINKENDPRVLAAKQKFDANKIVQIKFKEKGTGKHSILTGVIGNINGHKVVLTASHVNDFYDHDIEVHLKNGKVYKIGKKDAFNIVEDLIEPYAAYINPKKDTNFTLLYKDKLIFLIQRVLALDFAIIKLPDSAPSGYDIAVMEEAITANIVETFTSDFYTDSETYEDRGDYGNKKERLLSGQLSKNTFEIGIQTKLETTSFPSPLKKIKIPLTIPQLSTINFKNQQLTGLEAPTRQGNSGSPVFVRMGGDKVYLVGASVAGSQGNHLNPLDLYKNPFSQNTISSIIHLFDDNLTILFGDLIEGKKDRAELYKKYITELIQKNDKWKHEIIFNEIGTLDDTRYETIENIIDDPKNFADDWQVPGPKNPLPKQPPELKKRGTATPVIQDEPDLVLDEKEIRKFLYDEGIIENEEEGNLTEEMIKTYLFLKGIPIDNLRNSIHNLR